MLLIQMDPVMSSLSIYILLKNCINQFFFNIYISIIIFGNTF